MARAVAPTVPSEGRGETWPLLRISESFSVVRVDWGRGTPIAIPNAKTSRFIQRAFTYVVSMSGVADRYMCVIVEASRYQAGLDVHVDKMDMQISLNIRDDGGKVRNVAPSRLRVRDKIKYRARGGSVR